MDLSGPALYSERGTVRPWHSAARRSFCRLALCLIAVLESPLLLSGAPAAEADVLEYELKAAFLYNFARFVEWPDDGNSGRDLVICILGDDPFGDAIDAVARGRQIRGRSITVIRVEGYDEISRCDVLFISRSEKRRFREITSRLDGDPVLTVGDSPSFLANSGMINLELIEQMVAFSVNLVAANKSGLTISSTLMRLARKVQRGGQ